MIRQFLDHTSRSTARWILRMSRDWPRLAVGAVFMLGVSLIFLWYALREPALAPPPPPFIIPTATSTLSLAPRALDGVLVHPSSTQLLALAVVVENSLDARPLDGPAKADLVIEAPVEGSITRSLLFFDASTTVALIGPVRSSRTYFVDWAEGLQAMFVHVGGSPDSLNRIAASKTFRDLNEYWNGWAFWRSNNRLAPHHVMTRTDLLLRAAERKKYQPGAFRSWLYRDFSTSTVRTVTHPQIRVPYEGSYRAEWRYDPDTNMYTRYRAGVPERDADGSVVNAQNVVLLQTQATVVDELGRLKLRTTGKGRALLFRDGERKEVTWSRAPGEHLSFTTVDGLDAAFARGKTWISVITSAAAFGEAVSG